MARSCSVVGCHSSARTQERKFFRFPMLNHRSPKSLALTQARQDAWVRALNRIDFFPCNYKNALVCDRHFLSGIFLLSVEIFLIKHDDENDVFFLNTGKSAQYTDISNVDWIPTLNLGYEIKSDRIKGSENFIYEEPPSIERVTNGKETQTDFKMFSVATQTDDEVTGISNDIIISLKEKIAFLEEVIYSKKSKRKRIRKILSQVGENPEIKVRRTVNSLNC